MARVIHLMGTAMAPYPVAYWRQGHCANRPGLVSSRRAHLATIASHEGVVFAELNGWLHIDCLLGEDAA